MITNEFEYIFLRCNLGAFFYWSCFFLFDDLGIPCCITDTSSLLDWLANVFTNTLFYHKLWNLFLSIFTVIYGCIMKHSKPQKFKKKKTILFCSSRHWSKIGRGSNWAVHLICAAIVKAVRLEDPFPKCLLHLHFTSGFLVLLQFSTWYLILQGLFSWPWASDNVVLSG